MTDDEQVIADAGRIIRDSRRSSADADLHDRHRTT